MSKYFTLVLSQAVKDFRDYCIHLRHENEEEKPLVHLKFTDQPGMDENFFDEVVHEVAQMMARRIREQEACGTGNEEPSGKAVRTTKKIIKNLKEIK